MASFKKVLILGFLWMCPVGLSAQESVHLLWTHRTIDLAPILEFSSMNENEIVAVLRKKPNLKVVILEGKPKLKNPNLTIGNLEEDAKLVEYLQAERKLIGDDPDNAQHISPYEHWHSNDTVSLGPRPLLDHFVISLPASATRETILHEFLHYYLENLVPVSPVEVEGILHDSMCAAFLEIQNLEKELKAKQLKFYRWDTPKDQKDILEREILLLNGKHFLKGLEYLLARYGEEMDVHRFMVEHRKELNLTTKEASRAKDRVQGYSNLLLGKLYTELHIIILTDKFNRSHWKTDPEVEELYKKQIARLLGKAQMNIDVTIQWFNSQR